MVFFIFRFLLVRSVRFDKKKIIIKNTLIFGREEKTKTKIFETTF